MDLEAERERDRQREADRLASEQNPPRYGTGDPCEVDVTAIPLGIKCPLLTPGCRLRHDGLDKIPAEVLEARIAANQAARKKDGEHRQD